MVINVKEIQVKASVASVLWAAQRRPQVSLVQATSVCFVSSVFDTPLFRVSKGNYRNLDSFSAKGFFLLQGLESFSL